MQQPLLCSYAFQRLGTNSLNSGGEMAMKFDIIGSDDLSFPVTIEGSLTVKELFDKVQSNHQHVLTSIGQAARSDFLLALRYKENHALAPNEVISQVLSNGENLIAIWASTISRVAPGRQKSVLFKLAQHVAYANGSFFCTLGIIDSLAINAPQVQAVDSKSSAPKKRRVNEASKTNAAPSFQSAPAPIAVANGSLPSILQQEEAESSTESSTGSSSSSVSSESSHSKRAPVPSAQIITHTVHITDSSSESVSSASSSSVSSSSSSAQSSSSSSSSTSSSHASAKKIAVQATPKAAAPMQSTPKAAAPMQSTPKAAVPAGLQARATKALPAPRADAARKSIPAKVANAAVPLKSEAPMPSPAAPTEKAILAQISTGVAIPSNTPKKRGARGGKNSVANKAKTAATT